MSIDDFLGLLAESDEELVELGLKKGKSRGSRDQKKKAEKKARQAAVPVKKWAQASSQKKASVKAKRAASNKRSPARAAAANKPENVKNSAARKAKIKQAKLQKKIKAGNKKISAAEKKVRNLKKRKAKCELGFCSSSVSRCLEIAKQGSTRVVGKVYSHRRSEDNFEGNELAQASVRWESKGIFARP